jgi:hypothetical protein
VKSCFVIMPISVPSSCSSIYNDNDHFKHVLDHLFAPAINAANFEVVPPNAVGSDLIHAEIIKNLEECDLVVCDISTLNPNVFFELGIRTALDKPIALVRDNHTAHLPFDTGSINTHTYEAALQPWTIENQIQSLTEHITRAAARSDGRSSLWRYFGLTQRAAPAEITNPEVAKLDLILSQINALTRRMNPDKSKPSPSMWANTELRDSLPRVLAKLRSGALASDIPPKYIPFVTEAESIATEVGAKPKVLYDPDEDAVVIDLTEFYTSKDVNDRIDAAGEKHSVRFVYLAGNLQVKGESSLYTVLPIGAENLPGQTLRIG